MRIQRTLPPTAAPVSLSDLVKGIVPTRSRDRHLERITAELKESFQIKHLFLLSSGKAALTVILRSLRSLLPRTRVVIPAYTCFSVPSAIVKCGLDIVLCDVDPTTLDFNFSHLEQLVDDRTLCVIPTHLLGIPSDMDRVMRLAKIVGAFVIEDAAQAMGGTYKGRPLGSVGDAGFFSLGRGKNITCGSGGIVVTNCEAIAPVLRREYQNLPAEPLGNAMRSLASLAAMWLFIRPSLYWFPSSLPFLHLGETFFCPEFPEWKLGRVQGSLLFRWKQRLEWSNHIRCSMAQALSDRLGLHSHSAASGSSALPVHLRLPFLLETPEDKRELCRVSKRQGLGISPMYPTAIDAIPALAGRFGGNRYPGATAVAHRLVTLPVHHLVNPMDLERIVHATQVFTGILPGVFPVPARWSAAPVLA
jgi:dTDP-4-amino-4,6-dideoxygalactose transaminase